MKCFRLRCYVNNSFLVFHQGTKHSKTIKHSRFALVFHTVFSCLDPLMKHSNSLFTYNIHIYLLLWQTPATRGLGLLHGYFYSHVSLVLHRPLILCRSRDLEFEHRRCIQILSIFVPIVPRLQLARCTLDLEYPKNT